MAGCRADPIVGSQNLSPRLTARHTFLGRLSEKLDQEAHMYREVTRIEIAEVLRLWLAGTPKKRIAAVLGLDRKTVRHYVGVAEGTGLLVGPPSRRITSAPA